MIAPLFIILVLCLPLVIVVIAGSLALRRRRPAKEPSPNAAQRLMAQFYRS